MLKINEYGRELQRIFVEETTTIQQDVDNGSFLGTMFYEDKIKTMHDAIGWMLETFDTDALFWCEEWLKISEEWYVNLHELHQELEKIISEKTT